MKDIQKEGNTRIINGRYQLSWACPYESRNGKVCGKSHWIDWDRDFDSPCDGESLYCEKHATKREP